MESIHPTAFTGVGMFLSFIISGAAIAIGISARFLAKNMAFFRSKKHEFVELGVLILAIALVISLGATQHTDLAFAALYLFAGLGGFVMTDLLQ